MDENIQYIARQPIFDAARSIRAYELLFRDSFENRCNSRDPELASKQTIDTAVLLGLDVLSDGHDIFLNCTHDLIVSGIPTLFPADLTVVEVLETAQASSALLHACRQLKRSGYRIALDDFVPQPGYEALIEIADVIKVDFRSTSLASCTEFSEKYRNSSRRLLAEKVETSEEFAAAVDLGYSLFQGYLFSRPNILSTSAVQGLSGNQARVLAILGNPVLDFAEAEKTIKSDPALSYRLLRFLNSPAFCLHSEIRSIHHALTLLGEDEVRKWLLLAAAVIGLRHQSPHLLSMLLVRGRFAELLGAAANLPASSMFILGLLSNMDVVLNIPRSALADQVAVSNEIRAALKGEHNRFGRCLELAVSYEMAAWDRSEEIRKDWKIPSQILSRSYLEAVQWAKRTVEA